MARPLPLIATLAALTLALPGGVAIAQVTSANAVAELAAPSTEAQAIAGGVLWRCEGTSCVAAKPRERPLRVCRELVRKVGPVTRFEVDGKALDEGELARCNG